MLPSFLNRPISVMGALALLLFAVTASASATSDADRVLLQGDRYFVIFEEAGAYHYQGGEPGLPRTANERSGMKFDAARSAVVSYRDHLASLREERLNEFESVLGRKVAYSYEYDVVFNGGVIGSLSSAEAGLIARLPGVSSVEVVRDYELATDRGPWFIGANTLWSGAQSPGGIEFRGEGQVMAVLDTGLNIGHPAFSNDPACGFDEQNPKVIAAKDCLGSATCTGANPVDANGHGSHTASTAVGNNHVATGGALAGIVVSGIAPCANLISYKVCATSSCDGGAIAAAIQTALVDQVDGLNYSISGGQNPWSPGDADSGFLTLVDAGTFVAASAGNTRDTIPNPIGQVNHRGPWVMTVANSTHDRISSNPINVEGGPQNVHGLRGQGPFPGDISATLVDAQALGNLEGCNPGFTAGSMTGQIALISRGSCGFVDKINNATAAGAIGVIVHNNTGAPPIVMGGTAATTIPGVMTSLADGTAIRSFTAANPGALVSISATTINTLNAASGDILSSSSLRGPIAGGIEVTKPDITGPGTNIFAAVNGAPNAYNFLSGTSMSGPHVAGAGMLVKGLNPDWSIPEVKSAMQLTASRIGSKDFTFGTPNTGNWDADDVGNGRVDLTKAARAGLVLNETTANFTAANGSQANQRALNLPSMRNTACTPNCIFVRTVRNTLDTAGSWTVTAEGFGSNMDLEISPTSFSFSGGLGETQELTITVSPVGDQTAAVVFADVVMTEQTSQSPQLHMTVAVSGDGPPRADVIFGHGFEAEGGGPNDIVVVDNVNFAFPATSTGGSIQWQTGETCQCDIAPYNFNVWSSGGNIRFFWPGGNTKGGVAEAGDYLILAPGATVGGGSTFITSNSAPAWQAGADGFLGFRFVNSETSEVNYGYARITSTAPSGFPITVVSYAYNQAGDPITIPVD